jgi:hypothetical protein
VNRKKAPAPPKSRTEDEQRTARRVATNAVEPAVTGAIAVQAAHRSTFPDLDLEELIGVLAGQAREVRGGDLARMEAMLVTQAAALDGLFATLLRRALLQDTLPQYEAHMKFALKAQAQARATVEALSEIKNPRSVAFVKQANVGTNVQVNNDAPRHAQEPAPSRGESETGQNRLLGADDGGTYLDPRAAGESGRGDPSLAAVGEVDRTTDGSGQGDRRGECVEGWDAADAA